MAVPMANPATNGSARRDHRRNTRHAHADRSPPKTAPPRPLRLPVPASRAHPHVYRTPRPVCDCHCVPSSLIKSRIKTEAPHQQSLSIRRICMGFPPVPVHRAPINLGPRTVGSSGAAGWVRKYGCASHTFLRVFVAGRVASTRCCLTHVCHGRRLGARTRSRPASHTCGLSTQC